MCSGMNHGPYSSGVKIRYDFRKKGLYVCSLYSFSCSPNATEVGAMKDEHQIRRVGVESSIGPESWAEPRSGERRFNQEP